MHLINEIGIRKTYADSRYRDRGPLINKMCAFMCIGTVHLRVIILCILYPRVCRCLRGYEVRTRQFPVGGPAPSTTATPASAELGATPPNINTSTADTVPVDTVVNNPSDDTTRAAVAKISMFDFMVAAKAELEEHSAWQTARLPLVGMSRGEGHCVWTRPRLLELCRTLLWSASAEEEDEQASRLNEGTTGGPSSGEIAAQVSLSSIGASHGEPTVSAISVEMVPIEGYCDGAAVLSIDVVLGHAFSVLSPLSQRGAWSRDGGGVTQRTVADSRLHCGPEQVPQPPRLQTQFPCCGSHESSKKFHRESAWPVCHCPVGSKVACPASSP